MYIMCIVLKGVCSYIVLFVVHHFAKLPIFTCLLLTANENTHLQAHIINGHVLLVTKKELKLEKELIKFREDPHDLDFTTCKHKGKPQRFNVGGRKQKKKKRQVGMVQKFK